MAHRHRRRLDVLALGRDFVIAAPVGVIVGMLSWMSPGELVRPLPGPWPSVLVGVIVALVATPRRRWPIPTFIAALTAAFLLPLVLHEDGGGGVLLAFVVYAVMAADRRLRPRLVYPLAAGALIAGAAVFAVVTPNGSLGWEGIIVALVLVAYPVGLGATLQRNHDQHDELRRRADELDRLRSIEADQAVNAERARIARELHDIVAHHISAVVLHANTTRTLRSDDQAATALREIATHGTQALQSMRTVLGLLRATGPDDQLLSQPGLAQIPDLVGTYRNAGLDVTLRQLGEPRPVEDAVALAVYRLVQEGLTNVLRHSQATTSTVTLDWRTSDASRALSVSIDDNGIGIPAGHAPRRGHGTVGMHERVAACNGRLHIGPSHHGGWSVNATLPIG